MGRVCIGLVTGTGRAVGSGITLRPLRWTMRLQDLVFSLRIVHGTEPTTADIDVVEIFGAIGISLGPFSADCGPPAMELEES